MPRTIRTLILLACTATLACTGDAGRDGITTPPGSAAPPAVLAPNGLVSATAGTPLSYDACRNGSVFSDPAGRGLTYAVSFSGVSDGLTANGAVVSGTPAGPGTVTLTVTATDALGRTASDRFAIVVFAPGLPTPTLPLVLDAYADASSPLPAHFLAPIGGLSVIATDNTPAENPVTDAGATLGRVLFYDPRLSASDGTSCGSCHVQSLGFGDARQRSVGFAGGLTGRHSTALANARFYRRGRFFWDERAPSLEAQVVTPIQDATEMGMPLDALVQKLSATPYYAPLFTRAFGSGTVTSERIASALAQYVRSLVSAGSRYDRAIAAGGPANLSTLTAEERAGEQLFRNRGCAGCHTTVAQVMDSVHNIGLDAVVTDQGAGGGAFKAPSLRNVAVRGRYMHDGRFTSLMEVVDFYNAGVQANPGLDRRLRAPDGSPRRLGMTVAEKAALVAFLRTLTDSAFLAAPKFSDPFAAPASSR
ncbi:MAG: cytochrome c peroxidase [Longimicrobiaceae bacterium]